MDVRRWTRDARLSFARLPGLTTALGMARVPDAPQQAVRDLWPGDPMLGGRLMKGELVFRGLVQPLAPGYWSDAGGNGHATARGRAASQGPLPRSYLEGFTWLRHLRALGTDSARLRARTLVADWLQQPPVDPSARSPDVVGERVNAWLAHYDFFAASADNSFRQRLMAQLVIDSRSLAAMIPCPTHDHRALSAYKGLLACAVSMPEQGHLLTRYMRHIAAELGRQLLLDGCHVERSPAAQLAALRELAEMRALMQNGQIAPPLALAAALDRMTPALRALRHADGGLALFNGSQEESPALIDLVLVQATRGRAIQAALPEGGFIRLQVGRCLLFVDAGPPPPIGYDALSHAGTLSFELSIGRERLIVNCGGGATLAWQEALRRTAAHSVLTIGDSSSSDFAAVGGAAGVSNGAAPARTALGGISRRPAHVEIDHKQSSGAHWLDLSHDGYMPAFGAVHRRRLYLAASGEDIRGEDFVEADKPVAFVLRFHLHPDVMVRHDSEPGSLLLTLASGGQWRMRIEGGAIAIDESVYLGAGAPQPSRQIAVAVTPPLPDTEGFAETVPGEQGGEQGGEPQVVRWAISRMEA